MDTQTIQTLLILILFALGMLTIFLMTHPRGNRRSNSLLGSLLLAWLLMLLESWGILSGWTVSHTRLAFWTNQLFWVLGPLLFFYARSVLNPQFRLRRAHLWHFLPFFLMLLATQAAWQSLPGDIRTEAIKHAYSMKDAWLGWLVLIPHIQFGIYWFLAFRELRRYRHQLANNFSNEDQVQLPWLRFLLWGILVVVFLGAVQNLFRFLSNTNEGYELSLLLSGVVLLVFFGWLILKALRQPEIFSGLAPLAPAPPQIEPLLDEQDQVELIQLADRLKQHMVSHQIFLQPDLSLKELAMQLSVSPRELSRAINRVIGQSFFDYINQQRIELAKEKILHAKDTKVTVLEIMYEVGFQSKSSFNTAFKKFAGMTPTQWKQHAKQG